MNGSISSLSIIIPVYNEIECLKKNLSPIINEIKNCVYVVDLIFICSGCTDKSEIYIKKILEKSNIKYSVVIEKSKNGYGSAIKLAFEHVKNDFFTIYHVDCQYSLHEVLNIHLKNNNNVVTYRVNSKSSFLRKLQSLIYVKICNILFSLNLSDINSVKILKKNNFKSLANFSNSSIIELEFLIHLKFKSIDYVVQEINLYERNYGKSKVNLVISIKLLLAIFIFRLKINQFLETIE